MVPALDGSVTKAALFVRPQYAQERDLLALTKFKLHEAGFIVIYEEYRRLNEELADTIAIQLDRAAFMSGLAEPLTHTKEEEEEGNIGISRMFTRTHATSVSSNLQEFVGHAYLYVLARRNCHAELLTFIDSLFADEDYKSLVLSLNKKKEICAENPTTTTTTTTATMMMNNKQEEITTKPSQHLLHVQCPLFCNATNIGAKQAVHLLFPRMLVHDVPSSTASREYVQAELKDALLPALVELSKAKPENPIRWLAERLLNTNKRAPPLISKSEMNVTS